MFLFWSSLSHMILLDRWIHKIVLIWFFINIFIMMHGINHEMPRWHIMSKKKKQHWKPVCNRNITFHNLIQGFFFKPLSSFLLQTQCTFLYSSQQAPIVSDKLRESSQQAHNVSSSSEFTVSELGVLKMSSREFQCLCLAG